MCLFRTLQDHIIVFLQEKGHAFVFLFFKGQNEGYRSQLFTANTNEMSLSIVWLTNFGQDWNNKLCYFSVSLMQSNKNQNQKALEKPWWDGGCCLYRFLFGSCDHFSPLETDLMMIFSALNVSILRRRQKKPSIHPSTELRQKVSDSGPAGGFFLSPNQDFFSPLSPHSWITPNWRFDAICCVLSPGCFHASTLYISHF